MYAVRVMIGIDLSALAKRFGDTRAVDDVNLRIEPGELFFLLGPSGCGKTTLMRIIAGLVAPDAGRVAFDDRDVTDLPTAKRNAAMVFQGYALWPHMTVAQNVAFGLDVRKIPAAQKRQRVAETLGVVRLEGLEDRKPLELSGGQQQRVALARALVVKPDVLLLDEPLSNLDAELRVEMRAEIRRICHAAQITAVYVTHDQAEAMSIADRVALMRDGRIEQVGTPEALYRRPRSRFVAGFLGRVNFIEGRVVSVETDRLRLEAAGLQLIASVNRRETTVPQPGEAVTCGLRPEAIRVLPDGQDADNVIEARAAHASFLGSTTESVYDVGGGLSLMAQTIGRAPAPRGGASTARLGFDASDLVLLADEELPRGNE
jgi:iron(III) transport system ATP-binding protein